MGYRNGTYVSFAGFGETNPTKSDIKYFNILKAWNESKEIDFDFINSHEKTYKVLDTSSEETLLKRLRERLNNSKNLLFILTSKTKQYYSKILNFELDYAINIV